MSSKRQELLTRATTAHAQAVLLRQNAQNVHDEYVLLREKLDPQINKLSREADILALKFRSIYAEARERFIGGDKDGAAELKEKGYPIEMECRRLNGEANALRRQCDDKYREYKELFKKADHLDVRASRYKEEAAKLRETNVSSFSENAAMNDGEVELFLDGFPQGIFKKIQSITYNDVSPRNVAADKELGRTTLDVRSNKVRIVIYGHPNKLFMQETIAHEIGHTIYRYFMNNKQRWEWGRGHEGRYLRGADFITPYAREGVEENFCECFAYFKLQPGRLVGFDEQAFNFINAIYNSIKQ